MKMKDASTGNLIKTGRIRVKENRKRFYFILKVILFISLVLIQRYYPFSAGEDISAYQVGIIAYYVLANIMVTIGRLIIVNLYIKRNQLKNDDKDNFIIGVDRIASLLNIVILIVTVFYFFHIDPQAFLTSISLVAVALVLLFKDYISNLMNGMLMMFSDQFHINDYIKVGDFKGRILDINLANVKIKSDEGELMYIPNNLVYLKEVINYSKTNSSVVIIEFDLNMKLFGCLPQLETHLFHRITDQFGTHLKKEGIILKVERIKKEEALMKFVVELNKNNKRLEKIIHRFCNFLIIEFINKELKMNSIPQEN